MKMTISTARMKHEPILKYRKRSCKRVLIRDTQDKAHMNMGEKQMQKYRQKISKFMMYIWGAKCFSNWSINQRATTEQVHKSSIFWFLPVRLLSVRCCLPLLAPSPCCKAWIITCPPDTTVAVRYWADIPSWDMVLHSVGKIVMVTVTKKNTQFKYQVLYSIMIMVPILFFYCFFSCPQVVVIFLAAVLPFCLNFQLIIIFIEQTSQNRIKVSKVTQLRSKEWHQRR